MRKAAERVLQARLKHLRTAFHVVARPSEAAAPDAAPKLAKSEQETVAGGVNAILIEAGVGELVEPDDAGAGAL